MSKKISVSRYFTSEKDLFTELEWVQRDCGEEGFFLKDVEVPKHWSQTACDIVVGKYFRRTGVPETGSEKSIWNMVRRVCKSIASAAVEQNVITESDEKVFTDELSHLVLWQKASFNSPVWFNCGLSKMYGIHEEGESYFFDEEKEEVLESGDTYSRPQSSACFIQSLQAGEKNAYKLLKDEARVFKYGSGSGTNFSLLKDSEGTPLIEFLDIFDRSAAAIRSGGVARRAAKMVCLDVDHPDVEKFIEWKVNEEEKARTLVNAGYSSSINGEVYKSIAGQNANHSIRVTNSFMSKKDEVFDKIAEAAWKCGDPGLQFSDTIQSWNPVSNSARINASNPCSEYMFVDDSACNLSSLNLAKFYIDGVFDVSSLRKAVRLLIIAQEVLVGMSGYPTQEIAKNSYDYRPLGLGFTNLGTLLMNMCVPYDSKEGRDAASGIAACLHGEALNTSMELARVVGPFKKYTENKESVRAVIEKHVGAFEEWSSKTQVAKPILQENLEVWRGMLERLEASGLRNAQVTAIAPTGTISFMMDCDTTGIEPEFSFLKRKELVSGDEIVWLNSSLQTMLNSLGYSDSEAKKIVLSFEEGKLAQNIAEIKKEHRKHFQTAQGEGEFSIRAEGHVGMMAAVQPFVSGAISKTVNLPQSSKVEDVKRIYVLAWEMGLKSIAIYRDGSKAMQPLQSISCLDCG